MMDRMPATADTIIEVVVSELPILVVTGGIIFIVFSLLSIFISMKIVENKEY